MAEVFRAESEGLQGFPQVAIKRVLPHLSEKKALHRRCSFDEARISAQLTHSNCVQVFDIGVGDNAYFIVMEFVDGANPVDRGVAEEAGARDFPSRALPSCVTDLQGSQLRARAETDHQGMPLNIVHRDMSPPNVLVTKYGEVKIVDFGLAKASSQLEKSGPASSGRSPISRPKRRWARRSARRPTSSRSASSLWELLSGQRLFLGETDFQTVKKVQQTQVPRSRR